MKLSLVFRIYAGLSCLFLAGGIFAPEAIMEGYGFTMNEGMSVMLNFMLGMQLILILVTWQLPAWLGDGLSKAGLTYVIISLIPPVQGFILCSPIAFLLRRKVSLRPEFGCYLRLVSHLQ